MKYLVLAALFYSSICSAYVGWESKNGGESKSILTKISQDSGKACFYEVEKNDGTVISIESLNSNELSLAQIKSNAYWKFRIDQNLAVFAPAPLLSTALYIYFREGRRMSAKGSIVLSALSVAYGMVQSRVWVKKANYGNDLVNALTSPLPPRFHSKFHVALVSSYLKRIDEEETKECARLNSLF